jgi:Rieske 2Fe-2S family protein
MATRPDPASPLLDHCPEGLPVAAYLDADWFAREQRAIWARNWVYVGRKAELSPGTVRRVAVAGQSLILCRDDAGQLTAFHNTCRHRGAELCAAVETPLRGRITCPYHAWTYAPDGRLLSTGFATPTDDFRREDHRLFPVAVKVWNGFVFLCLADDPPDLSPDLGLAALDHWPMDTLVTGYALDVTLACNWKIFWENYNECLHCPGIHPELSDRVPAYRKGIMTAKEAPDWTPGAPTPPVLKDGARTWTVSGQPCGPEFPDLTPEERAAGHTFVTLLPSMFVVAHVDYVRAVSLTPLGPELTGLRAEWLFAPETLAQPGFDMAGVTDFATTVLRQDAAACEMNQRGLHSDRFRCSRLMPQEFDIHNFHSWVRARMAPQTRTGETP